MLLVEPGGTRTGFDDNTALPDCPLGVYARQRQTTSQVVAEEMNGGDDPTTAAKAIVAAATDPKPKLRYTGGTKARRLSTMRHFVPAKTFDKQLRKNFKLAV